MKPDFALSLSFDGITLLHRAAGGWRRVGEISLETADLAADLAVLRGKAARLAQGPVTTKLILPNDQIRYLSVDTGSFEGDTRTEIVRGALASATPYALEDLAYDLCPDGPVTHVAAVARETLAEAEAFATENDLGPVSFAAIPGDQGFLGEPFFGETGAARSLTGGDPVEPDGVAVVVIGDVPEAPIEPPIEPPIESGIEPTIETAPDRPERTYAGEADAEKDGKDDGEEEGAERDGDTPVAQFSSRRERRKHIRQERRAARQETEDEAPEPDTQEPARRLTLDTAPRGDAAPAAAEDETGQGAPAEAVPAPLSDPDHRPPDLVAAPEPRPDADPDADVDAAPEPVSPEPAVNVTAPVLDIPEFPDDAAASGDPEPAAQGFGGFFSRRRLRARRDPAPPAPARDSEALPAAASASPTVPALPITLPPDQVPQTEAARMTVFGARQPGPDDGKPRHLGLLLTALLLAFLAGVAAWASLFLEDGLSGLFDFGPPGGTEIAAAPAPRDIPHGPTPSVLSTDPSLSAPPGAPGTPASAPAGPESAPGLSGTDIAVLDALQTGDDQAPVSQAPEPQDGDAAPQSLTALPEPGDEIAALPPLLPADPEAGFDGQPGAAQTLYAATGIWPNAPAPPLEPGIISLDDLFLAAIDRTDLAHDAVALPNPPDADSDRAIALPSLPAAPGTRFALDRSGLVDPSPGGTLNPDGVLVYSGPPPIRPRSFPVRFETEPEIDALRQRLSELRPRARPGDLVERAERSQLGGLTREELARVRPSLRPASVQETAQAPDAPEAPPTAQAVARSLRPDARPADLARRIATISPPRNSAPEPGSTPAATVAPRLPTSASVARQATVNNAINLRKINLIGVYGNTSDRRALVRLPSGRYKKVKVGDSVDGGRVLAIGDSELRYQKGGRNLTLKIPSG